MGTAESNKKKTWLIIIGSIVVVLAILIAVGPSLVMKYMQTKWQDGPKYKVSNILMNVQGTIKISSDNIPYLVGDNNLYYVLEELPYDITPYVNSKCSVVAKIRQPKNSEKIDGNPVRLFLGVNSINILNADVDVPKHQNAEVKDVKDENALKEKALAKARLRVKANTILNKPILFDVIEGTVAKKERKDNNGKNYAAFILTDSFGDNYALYKSGKDFSKLVNKNIVCLGREIIPPSNLPLVVDETTFEIYEIYDENYKKLM